MRGILLLVGALGLMSSSLPVRAERRAEVIVYAGHGTPTSFRVTGRVLEDRDAARDSVQDGKRRNLARTIGAIDTNELRGVDLVVTVGGVGYGATTDADGMFQVFVKNLPTTSALPLGAQPVEAVLTTPHATAAAGRGVVHISRAEAVIGLISDIDDTVVKTFVTDKVRMAQEVFLKNAAQLEPVVGASAAYQKARGNAGGVDAVFYLSGSPQNLYRRLTQFLDLHRFPAGPLFLKNLEEDKLLSFGGEGSPPTPQEGASATNRRAGFSSRLLGHDDYKLGRLERIAADHPGMRFVLSGDSGERDPEIYAAFRARHPDRVVGVIIRLVPGSKHLEPARFAGMTTLDDVWPGDEVITSMVTASRTASSTSASASASPSPSPPPSVQ